MCERTSKSVCLALVLLGLLGLGSGCDDYGWLNVSVLVDLGLDGEAGLFNPFGEGSIFVPTNGGIDNEPPLPIVIGGDETGGGTGING